VEPVLGYAIHSYRFRYGWVSLHQYEDEPYSAWLGFQELSFSSHYLCHLDFFTVMSLALGSRNVYEDQPYCNHAATILPPEPKNFGFPGFMVTVYLQVEYLKNGAFYYFKIY